MAGYGYTSVAHKTWDDAQKFWRINVPIIRMPKIHSVIPLLNFSFNQIIYIQMIAAELLNQSQWSSET